MAPRADPQSWEELTSLPTCSSYCTTGAKYCCSGCKADGCEPCSDVYHCSVYCTCTTPDPTPPPTPVPPGGVQNWAGLVGATATSSTVHLSPDFKMGDYTGAIDFSGKVLVIWGSNATLDAAGKGQFFTGDGSKGIKTSLELHGLVMQNGAAANVSV